MKEDIFMLPEVPITDWDDRIFTAAEGLLDYLQLSGEQLSRAALEGHLAHLGVTEAQLPALMDMAERKGLLTCGDGARGRDRTRIPAMGRLLLQRLEAGPLRVREGTRRILTVLYGLEDGLPRSAEETAALLGIRREQVVQTELTALRRASRQVLHRRRIQDYLR